MDWVKDIARLEVNEINEAAGFIKSRPWSYLHPNLYPTWPELAVNYFYREDSPVKVAMGNVDRELLVVVVHFRHLLCGNAVGFCQGGAIGSLLDCVGSTYGSMRDPLKPYNITRQLTISYIKPVPLGPDLTYKVEVRKLKEVNSFTWQMESRLLHPYTNELYATGVGLHLDMDMFQEAQKRGRM